ncbi:ATP-binding protein [Pelagicoccus sp. SDUM812003]|uniref:sensor histidine kinase n=1 Tax=Pelagicoccus sp. SDUM812003 TaxID=3041267 RepID=UPI0028106DDE|nr:ATP-binding protein [Pelagicoccus sp. SDUM812003]MDQ8202577.1 ATP-binding protein [Pelagicoccus sp. SDUM812003]
MPDPDAPTTPDVDRCIDCYLDSFLNGVRKEDYRHFLAVFDYPDMRCLYVNGTAHVLLSPCSQEGIVGTFCLHDIVALDDQARFDSAVYPRLRILGAWSGQIGLRDLWGSELTAKVELSIKAHTGSCSGKYVCMKAEPVGAASFDAMAGWMDRELLAALLENSQDAIYFKDRHSRFIRASRMLIERFGLEHPHEVIGKTDCDFYDLSHAADAFLDEQRILESGVPLLDKIETETWPDGSETWVSSSKLPLRDSRGEVIGTFGISRDITLRKLSEDKRKELETKLLVSQRLEAIGSLAAGVAHEINTPTQFVSDNIAFIRDSYDEMEKLFSAFDAFLEKAKSIPELQECCDRIDALKEATEIDYIREEMPETINQTASGLHQIARIVRSLKEFSHPSQPGKSKADLNRAIENTVNISRGEWKNVAEVKLQLDPDLPEIDCVVDEINQVVLNLIVNASHAVEAADRGMGTIEVRTMRDENYACIEVSDTGTGIPFEIRDRLFEPFFTTKGIGEGTGQGLAMARNIVVKSHHGRIDFESDLGHGTTFRVHLPIQQTNKVASEDQEEVGS